MALMSSVFSTPVASTLLLPFSMWTTHGAEASVLAKAELPHLRVWLEQARRVAVDVDKPLEPLLATLSPPHERAWAQAMAWSLPDGVLPWAAQTAHAQGLHTQNPDAAWAFISLCNWHVSNGQVTLGDPAHLQIDDATDAALFASLQPFLAEDGIALHPYRPGQWLAQSPWFADLPTASLDRVIGRNIDPWLVGGEAPSGAAKQLRRLQNEVQMLLYTHPVNEGRGLTLNSFWVHGTGALPAHTAPAATPAPQVVNRLRSSALQQDLIGWLDAWREVDADVMAPLRERALAGERQRLVLCAEHEFHVYDTATPSLWQRVRRHFVPTSLDTVLAVAPLKD